VSVPFLIFFNLDVLGIILYLIIYIQDSNLERMDSPHLSLHTFVFQKEFNLLIPMIYGYRSSVGMDHGI
jgi:hypothetical protein